MIKPWSWQCCEEGWWDLVMMGDPSMCISDFLSYNSFCISPEIWVPCGKLHFSTSDVYTEFLLLRFSTLESTIYIILKQTSDASCCELENTYTSSCCFVFLNKSSSSVSRSVLLCSSRPQFTDYSRLLLLFSLEDSLYWR